MSTLKDLFWEIIFVGVPVVLFLGGYCITPVLLPWSWSRWVRQAKQLNLYAILSLAALIFATASMVVAISAIRYSSSLGGDFPNHFNNPVFMKMFEWGYMLSKIGMALGFPGLWRPNALRWHGLACAIGAWMFWTVTGGD